MCEDITLQIKYLSVPTIWTLLPPPRSAQENISRMCLGSGKVCSAMVVWCHLLHTWLPEAGCETVSLVWGGGGGGVRGGCGPSSVLILSCCGWAWCCPHLTLSLDVSGISAVTGETLGLCLQKCLSLLLYLIKISKYIFPCHGNTEHA